MWMGAKTSKGYGGIQQGGKGSPHLLAHRVAYAQAYGAIPDGMNVLHSCDNPWCVNPAHLRSGTQSENIKEAFDKGRKFSPARSGEANAKSKLNEEKVRMIRANPAIGHKQMADMLGVSPNCVRGVRIGRTWSKTAGNTE